MRSNGCQELWKRYCGRWQSRCRAVGHDQVVHPTGGQLLTQIALSTHHAGIPTSFIAAGR